LLRKKNNAGFTVIELIAAFLLLGIIGVFGSLFLVNMVKSYQWTKDNAHFAQQVQVVLTRIAVEMAYANEDSVILSDDMITYDVMYPDGTSMDDIQIGWDGTGRLLLYVNNDEYMLLDGVSSFHLEDSDGYFTVFLAAEGSNALPREFAKTFMKP